MSFKIASYSLIRSSLAFLAASLAILMWLVNYTKLGRAMRATAENPRVAGLMGVKPDMVISATFIIGAVLAAIAGVMYASNYGTAQHAMGFLPGLKAFTAAVFGGIGNLSGAVVGGILLGLRQVAGEHRQTAPADLDRLPRLHGGQIDPAAAPSRLLIFRSLALRRLLAAFQDTEPLARLIEQRLAVAADREVADALNQPLLPQRGEQRSSRTEQ